MWQHTVLLGDELHRHVTRWWKRSSYRNIVDAIEVLIGEGLARPVAVRDAFDRANRVRPGPGAPLMGGRVTIRLSPLVEAQVEAHRICYELQTPSAALRELMWLGLGLSPPKAPKRLSDLIRSLAQYDGLGCSAIAAEVGVSRQRVHAVLKEIER